MRKRLMAIVMTLMLGFTMVPYSSFAAITNDSEASITINNTESGEKFKAYKIIDISYNSGTNTVSAAFNSAFAEYFAGKRVSIDGFSSYASDSDNLKNLLSGLPAYINAKSISSTADATATGDSVSLTNLPMGEYFIIPTATTSIYQLMLQKIEPAVSSSGEYSLSDVTFNAKKKSVSVAKDADKTSVTKGETVKYTVTLDLPVYDLSATNKGFSVKDNLPTGLTLDTDSVSVHIGENVVDAGHYAITKSGSGFELKVEDDIYDDYWQTAAMAGKQLVITYSATLNAVSSDANVFNNKVKYTYSTFPFTGGTSNTITKEAVVKSYTIKVVKVDAGDTSRKLAGAKFDLYRTLKSGEDASEGIDIPGTAPLLGSAKKGKLLESGLTTDSEGIVLFKQYEANGTNYDYYLVETKAPAGYNLLQSAVQINFTAAETTGGIFTVPVENSTGFQLPITGDTGTILMSVIGLVLMGGAVVLLLLRKRKASRAK